MNPVEIEREVLIKVLSRLNQLALIPDDLYDLLEILNTFDCKDIIWIDDKEEGLK